MRRVSLGTKLVVLLLCSVGIIVYFSLRAIPAFEISAVKVVVDDGGGKIPYAVEKELVSLRGQSIFAVNLHSLEKKLSALAVVGDLTIQRKFPSTLVVNLSVARVTALVSSIDENGVQNGLFLVKNGVLLPVDREDWSLFKKGPICVEVPQGYATMLQEYGIDETFLTVMDLASSIDEDSSLITRIKYDNNSSNSFGKMVLEFSSLNAQIWVREPVSTARIASAVSLVIREQGDSLSFLSTGPLRYDLYEKAMVRRF
jgi:hypothetical protein